MDTLLNEISLRPNVIKIDVEGYEMEALKGAENILAQERLTLIIEIHPLQLTMSGSHESQVFDLLRRHRYEYEVFNRDQQWALYSIVAKPNA